MKPIEYERYIKVYNWTMEEERGNLRPQEALVFALVQMMTLAPKGKGCYYAGTAQMAERLNMTRTEVNHTLAKLQRVGAIVKGRRKIDGHICTIYMVNTRWNGQNQNSPV